MIAKKNHNVNNTPYLIKHNSSVKRINHNQSHKDPTPVKTHNVINEKNNKLILREHKEHKEYKEHKEQKEQYKHHDHKEQKENKEHNIKSHSHKLNKITFDGILSTESWYGVIWNGIYNNTEQCVIKMVLLSEGSFEDKRYFLRNDRDPFRHKEFYNRRSMSRESFLEEANKQKILNDYGLTPKVYDFWIDDKSFAVHYGFIVMERMDCTIKHILLKRDLTNMENQSIKILINDMHQEHKIVHRDLKPANIGVDLDADQQIRRCLILDCAGIKFKKKLPDDQFNKLTKIDWGNYEKKKMENIMMRNKR